MAAFAVFLAIPALNGARLFLLAALVLVLIPFCPCISAICVDCSCDVCVEKVGIIGFTLVVITTLLFFFVIKRRRRVN